MAKKTNVRGLVKVELAGREHLIKASIGIAVLIETLTDKSLTRLVTEFASGNGKLTDVADVLRAATSESVEGGEPKVVSRPAMLENMDSAGLLKHSRIAVAILAEFFKPRGDDSGNAEAATL